MSADGSVSGGSPFSSVESAARALFDQVRVLSRGEPEAHRIDIFKLRDQLTSDRDQLLSGYMNRPASFFAYLNYHFPLHLPEVFWIMDQNRARLGGLKGGGRLLDLGCGPGTATISLLLWMKRRGIAPPEHFELFDFSGKALDVAAELIKPLAPEGAKIWRERSGLREGLRKIKGRFDFVILSHVLNEFGSGPRMRERKLELVRHIGQKLLTPTGLLIIVEPPLREPTTDLMWLRDRVFMNNAAPETGDDNRSDDEHGDLGLEIIAPCPAKAEFCPLAFEKKGWCYAQPPREPMRAMGLAPLDVRLERMLKIQLTQPGFSYLVLKAKGSDVAHADDHALALSDSRTRPGWVCVHGRNVRYRSAPNEHRGAYLEEKAIKGGSSPGARQKREERGEKPEEFTRTRPKRTMPPSDPVYVKPKPEKPAEPLRREDGRLARQPKSPDAKKKRPAGPSFSSNKKTRKRS